MICKFCGNSIEDNSDFCFICGQKVEAETASFQNAESNDIFSQSAQASAAVEAAPAEAEVAQAAPVAAPVQVAEPAPAVCPMQQGEAGAVQCPYQQQVPAQEVSNKKGKKNKDKSKPTKALKFFTVLFLALFLALAAFMSGAMRYVCIVLVAVYALCDWKAYKKAKKLGYEAKCVAILNSTGIGAIIGMALILVKLFMTAYM